MISIALSIETYGGPWILDLGGRGALTWPIARLTELLVRLTRVIEDVAPAPCFVLRSLTAAGVFESVVFPGSMVRIPTLEVPMLTVKCTRNPDGTPEAVELNAPIDSAPSSMSFTEALGLVVRAAIAAGGTFNVSLDRDDSPVPAGQAGPRYVLTVTTGANVIRTSEPIALSPGVVAQLAAVNSPAAVAAQQLR